MAALVTLEAIGEISHFHGWLEWTNTSFEIRSRDAINVGVDGEALTLPLPLRFTILPEALRVRIPLHAPGSAPSTTG